MDKRAVFDFELDFINGGGLQGQGFRLDIDGPDISDDALAAHIISDLRLLMVGNVKIINKKIIEERHKRSRGAKAAERPGEPALIDLSHTIEDGMITYKGLPAPLVCDYMTHERSQEMYDPGTSFHFGRVDMVTNTGTYIDTPYHRFRDGHDLSALSLERVSGVEGVVIRVGRVAERAIDWKVLAACDVRGKAVLVQTGWDVHWGTDRYFEGHPYLTEAAAEFLRDNGAVVVGVDSLNIDNTDSGQRPVHSTLLAAEIPIVEHMTNLDRLPVEGFTFYAVPPKITKIGTFPVRAHALVAGRS